MNESLPTPSDDPVAQRIVSAARAHFFKHGFRGVTMDDLAAEMGMSKKTLYVHFKSKMELVQGVMLAKLSQFHREMTEILSDEPTLFVETLHRLLACGQIHAREVTPTFVRDLMREAPELIETMKARRRVVISQTFGRLLKVGQEANFIRQDITVEAQIAILLGATDAVVTPETVTARGVSPGTMINEVVSIFLHGVLTEKGRQQI
jgi:AcrR family transcriptional regulator